MRDLSNHHQVNYNSIVWSQAENGDTLVCVTGDSRIKVLNVRTGELTAVRAISLIVLHPLTLHPDPDRPWRCMDILCRLRRAAFLTSYSLSMISPYRR